MSTPVDSPRTSRIRTALTVGAGMALGGVLAIFLLGGPEPADPEPSSPAGEAVERSGERLPRVESADEDTCFVGAVVPREETDVAAEIDGLVESIRLRVGDRVDAGDALAVLDTRSLRHRLAIEQADLQAARAEKEKLNVEVDQSAQELERRMALSDLVSREEREAARFRVAAARAALAAAEAQVAQVEARITELRDSLDRSTLRAPFTGLVSRRYLDPGSRTVAGTPVLHLVRLDDALVRFAVPPAVAESLAAGAPVKAEIVTDRRTLTGTVEQIAPEIDPSSLLVFVEARLDVPAGESEVLFGAEARVRVGDGASASCLGPVLPDQNSR